MANLRNVAFINSFIDETRKTQRNFAAIREKKSEQSRKDELFKLQKKNIESQIKAREGSGDITPLNAKTMRDQAKNFSDLIKSQSDVDNAMLDNAQTDTMNKQKQLGSIARQITPSLTINTDAQGRQSSSLRFTTSAPKKVSAADKFQQGFVEADSSEDRSSAFKELGKRFPGKRDTIQEQRISGLQGKSKSLLGQILEVQKEEVKNAAKTDSTPRTLSETVQEFLGEIVQNKEQAERSGHNVDEMLDILGFTVEEILDNQTKPDKGFLDKIKEASKMFIAGGAFSNILDSFKGE